MFLLPAVINDLFGFEESLPLSEARCVRLCVCVSVDMAARHWAWVMVVLQWEGGPSTALLLYFTLLLLHFVSFFSLHRPHLFFLLSVIFTSPHAGSPFCPLKESESAETWGREEEEQRLLVTEGLYHSVPSDKPHVCPFLLFWGLG